MSIEPIVKLIQYGEALQARSMRDGVRASSVELNLMNNDIRVGI